MAKSKFQLISPNITDFIYEKIDYFKKNPSYYISCGSTVKSRLHEEANRHSISLELASYDPKNKEARAMRRREKKIYKKHIIGDLEIT